MLASVPPRVILMAVRCFSFKIQTECVQVARVCGVACSIIPDLRVGSRGGGSEVDPAGLEVSTTRCTHLELSWSANQIDGISHGDRSTSPHATRRRRSRAMIWKDADLLAQPQVMCYVREPKADKHECKSAVCICLRHLYFRQCRLAS